MEVICRLNSLYQQYGSQHMALCFIIFGNCGHVCFTINSADGNLSRGSGSVVFPID